jgi:hypothetical protein
MEERKEHEHHSKTFTDRIRSNPWMLATFVLAILCLILLFSIFSGSFTGNVISSKAAGEKLLTFYESMGVEGLTINSVEEVSGLYKVSFDYKGAIVPIYITKDGKNQIPSDYVSPLESESDTTETETEIVKSDKPSVSLYIWSYCPYGVTALAPFSDVAKLLGNYADFKVYLYYAGHGEHEEQQNKIQACIQELEYESYWDYAKSFAETIYTKCSGDIACDLKESKTLMTSLGIDSNKVLSCVSSQGKQLLAEDAQAAQDAGVQGSPTLVINGVQTSAARNAEAYKGAVCSAFNNIPSVCSETLDSTGTTASGNC